MAYLLKGEHEVVWRSAEARSVKNLSGVSGLWAKRREMRETLRVCEKAWMWRVLAHGVLQGSGRVRVCQELCVRADVACAYLCTCVLVAWRSRACTCLEVHVRADVGLVRLCGKVWIRWRVFVLCQRCVQLLNHRYWSGLLFDVLAQWRATVRCAHAGQEEGA